MAAIAILEAELIDLIAPLLQGAKYPWGRGVESQVFTRFVRNTEGFLYINSQFERV